MVPVSGQSNTYDMTRADLPVQEGTPINKALFDCKAYTLTAAATVYVSKSGSDTDGDGSSAAPYLTIQKAVDSLPKILGGYHAQIDIGAGTYEERVTIDGFVGGRLTIGTAGRTITVRGITVMSSVGVRICVSNLTHSANHSGALLHADYGSNVTIIQPITFRGEGAAVSAISAARGSNINASGNTVALLSFGAAAVMSTSGSTVSLETVEGNSNTSYGLRAERGGIIAYMTKNLTATAGDSTTGGGRIFSGAQTNIPSN